MRTRTTGTGLALVAATVALTMAAAGDAAQGIKVTINGVDVTGLTSQKFEGCTVAFDESGNISIEAPGYQIKKVDPPPGTGDQPDTTPAPLPGGKHYYLFTESKNGKAVGDKYTVLVNGSVVKQFESTDEVLVEDISPHLGAGSDQILVTAVKSGGYGGGNPKNWFRVVIGEGHEDDNKAIVEKTLHKFTRTADLSEPGQSAFTLKVQ